MYTQKMHEVQKYTTLSNHGYIGYVVVVNKKFWDGLPADIRANLDKAMAEATAYSNEHSAKENDEALDEMKKPGRTELITLTTEEVAAMQKAMEPVYKDMAAASARTADRRVRKTANGRDQLTRQQGFRAFRHGGLFLSGVCRGDGRGRERAGSSRR